MSTTTIALAMPIQPGQMANFQALGEALNGPRAAEYAARQARCGIVREQIFHQPTPDGDIALLVIEAVDPQRAIQVIATSEEPFDVWLREQLGAIHGVTPEIMAQIRPGVLLSSYSAG